MAVCRELVAVNPANGLTLAHYPVLGSDQIDTKILGCHRAHKAWQQVGFQQRAEALLQLAQKLESQRDELAALITREMGKPLDQAAAEIEKCAWVCRDVAASGRNHLSSEEIQLDGSVALVVPRPLGGGLRDHALELSFLAGFQSSGASLDGGEWIAAQRSFQCSWV